MSSTTVTPIFSGMKKAILGNWFTITQIYLHFLILVAQQSSPQGLKDTSSGSTDPYSLCLLGLSLW